MEERYTSLILKVIFGPRVLIPAVVVLTKKIDVDMHLSTAILTGEQTLTPHIKKCRRFSYSSTSCHPRRHNEEEIDWQWTSTLLSKSVFVILCSVDANGTSQSLEAVVTVTFLEQRKELEFWGSPPCRKAIFRPRIGTRRTTSSQKPSQPTGNFETHALIIIDSSNDRTAERRLSVLGL